MQECTVNEEVMETQILLRPEQLGRHLSSMLMKSLETELQDHITDGHGYILSIHKILDIQEALVCNLVPNVIFSLRVSLFLLYPEVNKTLLTRVDLIFKHGIFTSHQKIKCIIPIDVLKKQGYELETEFTTIHYRNATRSIHKHDDLMVRLLDIRIENGIFSCISEVVESEE